MTHDGMPYGRNQDQGQGHSREVDRQSPTGLIFIIIIIIIIICDIATMILVWRCNTRLKPAFTSVKEVMRSGPFAS